MATFVGYSTIGRFKNVTVTNFDLIKTDLLNAFNIRQGELPGRPGYGSNIWSFIFENQTDQTIQAITNEVQRVCGGDPRIFVQSIDVFPEQNGILIQIGLTYVNSTDSQRLSVFFDQEQRRASYV